MNATHIPTYRYPSTRAQRVTNLLNLAVMFRCEDPNLGHVDVFDAMTEAGLAYNYGLFRAIPKRHHRKRRHLAMQIAQDLELKAKLA